MQRISRLALRHVQRASDLAVARRLAAAAITAAGVAVAGSASAVIVESGVDVFHTTSEAVLETIPAGFFCAVSKEVLNHPLKGAPIVTSPSGIIEGIDTVIERLSDTGPGGTTDVRIVALHLVGAEPVRRCSSPWDVDVFLRPGSQPIGTMTIFQKNGGGGTYTASFQVLARAEFRRQTDGLLRTLHTTVDIQTDGPQDWAPIPGAGAVEVESAFWIDTNNDDVVDTLVPGTSNFAPGWLWDSSSGSSSASSINHLGGGHPIHPFGICSLDPDLWVCGGECGLGFELPLLLLPLLALRVARRR